MGMPDNRFDDQTQRVTYEYPAYSNYVETPSQPQPFQPEPPVDREPTQKPWLIVGLVAVAVIAIVGAVWAILANSGVLAAPESLSQWRDRMSPAATEVSDDMRSVQQAVDIESYPAVHEACTELDSDLQKWSTLLPTPNAEVTSEVAAGISEYRKFAAFCMTMTPSSTAGEGAQANDHLNAGNTHIENATVILNAEGA